MARIAIIGGGGYVGLTYAAAFAHLGHDVVGLDIDAAKVHALNEGASPIFEPKLSDLLVAGLEAGRLSFTTDYAQAIPGADFAFICVGTPTGSDGHPDLRYLVAAAESIAQHGQGHTTVVNKSTVPVGSVDLVAQILGRSAQAGASFAVVSNPEFLREGAAINDLFHPDRIVLGASDRGAAEAVAALYAPLGAPVLITDPRSAEMIKYAANAFLATKISFINEVALVCERIGADITSVAEGMGLDSRIGPRFLQAGAGFGGSCFPKDVRALAAVAHDVGVDPTILTAVLGINAGMRATVVRKLATHLGGLAGKSVAVLGLSFKPDTDDIRESPAVDVIRRLVNEGVAVRATDPVAIRHVAVELPDIVLVDDPYAAATGADAVVLMTEWPLYRSLDLEHLANAMRGQLLLDGRNAINRESATAAGLVYEGIGRTALPLRPLILVAEAQPGEVRSGELASD